MRKLAVLVLAGSLSSVAAFCATDSQTITLDQKLQIPGATLKSGTYTFEVEDRLQDRAIIRITDEKRKSHELLLSVPNEKLNQEDKSKLILFPTSSGDKQILQGWMCPSCQTALEVVYPKAEAVKITGVSAKPVLAVDPTYDKLPKNLTADDMKVVTLWLLSPKEVTADQKGKGIEAAKWADVSAGKTTEVADAKVPAAPGAPEAVSAPVSPSAPEAPAANQAPVMAAAVPPATVPAPQAAPAPVTAAPAAPVTAVASAEPALAVPSTASGPMQAEQPIRSARTTRQMPHTASNTFNFALGGLLFFGLGSGLRLQRKLQAVASK